MSPTHFRPAPTRLANALWFWQEEDIIVRLDDEPIRNTGELSKFLIAHPPGEIVTVVFFRGSEERTTQVTLTERPKG